MKLFYAFYLQSINNLTITLYFYGCVYRNCYFHKSFSSSLRDFLCSILGTFFIRFIQSCWISIGLHCNLMLHTITIKKLRPSEFVLHMQFALYQQQYCTFTRIHFDICWQVHIARLTDAQIHTHTRHPTAIAYTCEAYVNFQKLFRDALQAKWFRFSWVRPKVPSLGF